MLPNSHLKFSKIGHVWLKSFCFRIVRYIADEHFTHGWTQWNVWNTARVVKQLLMRPTMQETKFYVAKKSPQIFKNWTCVVKKILFPHS